MKYAIRIPANENLERDIAEIADATHRQTAPQASNLVQGLPKPVVGSPSLLSPTIQFFDLLNVVHLRFFSQVRIIDVVSKTRHRLVQVRQHQSKEAVTNQLQIRVTST